MIGQVFGGIILFVITIYLLSYIKKEGLDFITFFFLIILLSLWIIVLVPAYLNPLFVMIGFYRPFDVLIAIIATSSLILTLKLYISMKKIDKNITEIVRNEAIKEVEKEKKNLEKKV
ncbi:MAG: hypothetical protein DRN95_07440 [Candidatus Hydrothermarchaeota archaeon]|nr:MAG: hypothetical protein DRN95_07440 [Candidatus Hydrothermarchaeota archaeon]